jgi:peptidoglycan hydrolase CwlO-like protein
MASEIKKRLKNTPKGPREFGVILESIDSNVKHVVETVDTHTKQIAQLQNNAGSLKKDMAQVKDDVAAIKVTLESVNPLGLKQEVVALQKRVVVFESNER